MAFTVKPTRKQTGKVTTGDRYGAVDYSAPSVAAPAAPAPTYGAPSTHDAEYNQALGIAGLNRDQQLAAIAGQGERLRLNYGYLDDAKTLDPNNPFGQAQLLKRNYDQTKSGTTSSYAARGQQTSGAYNRMQGSNLFNYQQGDDRLQKSYDDARASLINQAAGIANDYASSSIGAEGDALARALAARAGVPQQAPQSSDRLLSSTKRKDGKTVNRYASGRVAVF
jgi:hypothetical protein